MKLFKDILNGNVSALSKGITLVESSLNKDKILANKLIKLCLPKSGKSIRIGITGVPGVGKSTFIETFGKHLTNIGKKVAVLTIDPSSEKTKGSILGDKSRMNQLAIDKNAFIRPSPNNGVLGGINNKTKESIILCEAAGFEVIIIETVGSGQSEISASNLTDFLLLLVLSGAGDELQGIKRGIMEKADMVAITKSDGDNIQNALESSLNYKRALHFFNEKNNGWNPKVITCSAFKNIGIKNIYKTILEFDTKVSNSGWKNINRNQQKIYWLHSDIKNELGNKKYHEFIENGKIKFLEKKCLSGDTNFEIVSNI